MIDQENNQFRPLRELIMKPGSISAQSRSIPSSCTSDVATRRTAIMLAGYRTGEAQDPQIYAASVAAVLSCYPQEVVYRVTDPRTGIQTKLKFMPSIAEVKTACEEEIAPIRAAEERRRRRFKANIDLARVGSPVSKAAWDALRSKFRGAEMPSPKRPEQLAEEYRSQPVTISEALKAILAVKRDYE